MSVYTSITNFAKKASMVKLVHHEMPVNKTLHHRTIEILTALTLLIGSPSFLIYFYCSHDTNNPLCQWLLCTLNHTPEDGEYLYNRYLVISITWAALIFGFLFVISLLFIAIRKRSLDLSLFQITYLHSLIKKSVSIFHFISYHPKHPALNTL